MIRLLLMLAVAVGLILAPARVSADDCRHRQRPVIINLDNDRHRHILDHAWDAVALDALPELLHIDRAGADRNRDDSLRGWPTRKGYDRDEFPPAVADEGGAGADVRYVRASENRSAGAVMGHQLSEWCDGQAFRFERRHR